MTVIKKYIKYIINKIKWSKQCLFDFTVEIDSCSKFEGMSQIHSKTFFKGTLGYGSYIGSHSSLSADIGRFTSIAPYVRCNWGLHPYTYPFATTSPSFYSLNPSHSQNGNTFATLQKFNEFAYYDNNRKIAVKIGSDCWIGEGAFLVGGIKLGNGVVVLAHAVVTKDIPDYAIVSGIPAKIIGYRYDNETIQFLQKTEWWTNSEDWFKKHWTLLTNIDDLKEYYKNKKIMNTEHHEN